MGVNEKILTSEGWGDYTVYLMESEENGVKWLEVRFEDDEENLVAWCSVDINNDWTLCEAATEQLAEKIENTDFEKIYDAVEAWNAPRRDALYQLAAAENALDRGGATDAVNSEAADHDTICRHFAAWECGGADEAIEAAFGSRPYEREFFPTSGEYDEAEDGDYAEWRDNAWNEAGRMIDKIKEQIAAWKYENNVK